MKIRFKLNNYSKNLVSLRQNYFKNFNHIQRAII